MDVLLLTHGAGSDCEAPLLVEIGAAFAARGIVVVRFNLPFRRARPAGPPHPAERAKDVEGIRAEVARAREEIAPRRLFLGGHSYGGRLASLLAAETPEIADALLLLGYPLRPPRKPDELRTAHWPSLAVPAFFASGTRDPFGAPEELRDALTSLGGRSFALLFEGAGHDVRGRAASATKAPNEVSPVADLTASTFVEFADDAARGVEDENGGAFGVRRAGFAASVRPGGYAVLRNEAGEVAVVRTPKGVFLPGGGIDPGESAEAATLREVREETGLEAALGPFLGRAVEHDDEGARGVRFEKRATFFAGRAVRAVGSGEADHALLWLPPEEALRELLHGSQRFAVRRALRLG